MTYSIVARDPESGELGVAVQSHWFSVGSIVPWALPGVGAVATQANAEASYGPRGLALMSDGIPAPEAVRRLIAEDALRESRQVAMVDAAGRSAAYTGTECMVHAGDVQAPGVSCQANIMGSCTVWPEMLEAYATAEGSLAGRLLAALDAAEAQGGDLRGRQSAAILVVPGTGDPWDTVVSLRVEDHPDPLGEVRRLTRLAAAYRLAGGADELLAAGRHDQAAELFSRAATLAPGVDELQFWAGVSRAGTAGPSAGLSDVRAAIEVHAGWLELLRRLGPAGLPGVAELLERLETGAESAADTL